MSEGCDILVAEDEEADVFLLKRAFSEVELTQRVQFVGDGEAAVEYLGQRMSSADDRMPSLIILDLKMPRRSGIDVVHWLRGQPATRCLPAVILSSSSRPGDVEAAYSAGANGFLVKPASTGERKELAQFIKQWLRFNRPPSAVIEGSKAAHAVELATRSNGAMRAAAGPPEAPSPPSETKASRKGEA